MKRRWAVILMFLFAMVVITGCGPDQEKIQKDFMEILEKPASEETIGEASAYLDQNLSKLDKEYAGNLIHLYEHYILEFNQEGIDYDQWIVKYEKYISPALRGFYQLLAEEQNVPMAEDAVLKISWDELLKRAYKMEMFIMDNKKYTLISDDLNWMYGKYLNALVMGTNGTPIFDYKTQAFSEDAKAAYAGFINRYPDSTTAWALTEYFTYLDSIQFTMDYNDKFASKLFFDTCDWLVSESGKRVFQ